MVNRSVTVLATTPPAAERGPDPPAGNVTRTRVPGRNGVDGVNVSVVPAFVQVPGVAGSRTGIGELAASGADSVTRTGLAPLVRVTAPPWVTDRTAAAARPPGRRTDGPRRWWRARRSRTRRVSRWSRPRPRGHPRRRRREEDLGPPGPGRAASASPGFPAAGLPPWPSPPPGSRPGDCRPWPSPAWRGRVRGGTGRGPARRGRRGPPHPPWSLHVPLPRVPCARHRPAGPRPTGLPAVTHSGHTRFPCAGVSRASACPT